MHSSVTHICFGTVAAIEAAQKRNIYTPIDRRFGN